MAGGLLVEQLTNLACDSRFRLGEPVDTPCQFNDLLGVVRVSLDEPGGRYDRIQYVAKFV